ncbi:MAG: hypothetical protein LBS09_01615 [Bacteroidales bacterium]|jgi:hypothetical protein|nr:hypothetical protein [Bacteroidales bacterium]
MFTKKFFLSCLLSLTVAGSMISCRKSLHKDCYKLGNVPVDTAFYVSYDLNDVSHKYYQMGHSGYAGLTGTSNIKNNDKLKILNCRSAYEFAELHETPKPISDFPLVRLVFHDIQTLDKPTDRLKQLSQTAQPSYRFTYVDIGLDAELLVADTAYMTGVALDIESEYTTQNVVESFKYDYRTAYDDVLNSAESFLEIVALEPLCDDFHVVKGRFATTLMKRETDSTYISVKITNGTFKFLTK